MDPEYNISELMSPYSTSTLEMSVNENGKVCIPCYDPKEQLI